MLPETGQGPGTGGRDLAPRRARAGDTAWSSPWDQEGRGSILHPQYRCREGERGWSSHGHLAWHPGGELGEMAGAWTPWLSSMGGLAQPR